MTTPRLEVASTDQWDLSPLYSNLEAWQKEYEEFLRVYSETGFCSLLSLRGRLAESPAQLASFLDEYFLIERRLMKLYTYAHLRHDEEMGRGDCKEAFGKAMRLLYELKEATSWVQPELLALKEEQMTQLCAAPELARFTVYLKRIIRMKPHTLSQEGEMLLAKAMQALEAPRKAFGALSNVDLQFPKVADSSGFEHPLTQGSYQIYLRSKDRVLRQQAFTALHNKFAEYQNTLCELLHGEVQGHWFDASSRNYSSSLKAALHPHEIDPGVYSALVDGVRARLPSLHRYVALRKKVAGLDELHLYDMSYPLVEAEEKKLSYDKAVELVVASVAPLGSAYQEQLQRGLLVERWVDKYENEKKRSGAYSSGCYDSHPYILMNYHGTSRDLFTLAHEAGHSMHSWLSRTNQSYVYHQYPIFLAEVASTLNEELLFAHLMKSVSLEEKMLLLQHRIDDFRATLFRQVMFAEFEREIHSLIEKRGIPTPQLLSQIFRQLNSDYFGSAAVIDPEIGIEWARIPHFYYNFYVYQYATGMSAALALVGPILKGDTEATKRYLRFLSSGCSAAPLDLLKEAGVDMHEKAPVERALDLFDLLVVEWAELAKK